MKLVPCGPGMGAPCSPDASSFDDGAVSSGDATLADDGSADADAGSVEASAPAATGNCPRFVTSCYGIDGLMPGTMLVFDVRVQTTHASAGICHAYDTTGLSGLPDVVLGAVPRTVSVDGNPSVYLTTASGQFSSSHSPGCDGAWDLDIYPPGARNTERLSPFEAGTNSDWLVYRRIEIRDLQSCDSSAPAGCSSICEDRFAVDRIGQVP